MRLKYSFEINEESEFSSENVARQNKDNDVIIINALDSNSCLLMLNKNFLDRFSLRDEVSVYGENLSSLWGYDREYIIFYNNFVPATDEYNYAKGSFFRSKVIESDDLDTINTQIKDARLFLESKAKKRNIIFVHTIEK